MTTPAAPKPLSKPEKIKQAKDGLDVIHDLERYAAGGLSSVDKDDLNIRFRWYGIYTQRPEEEGFFMLRVRCDGGQLTAAQLRKVADLADRYARGVADVTTRQNFQYHWVRLESLPVILRELAEVGLSTTEACGDTPRVVVGCPLAGRSADEVLDCRPYIRDLAGALVGKKDYSNLPRKYKSTVAGCGIHCHQPEINDLAFTAVRHPVDGRIGFTLRVGGGLSVRPHFSTPVGVFVKPEEMVEVGVKVTEIFRDHGYREKRNRARLKFLLADWGAEKFRSVLEEKLGRPLEHLAEPELPEDRRTDHLGIHPQRQPGLFYVGAPVIGGRLTSDKIRTLADLAERYGSGTVATTNKQNVIVLDVPEAKVADVVAGLQLIGHDPKAATFRKSTIACTGTEFCKLAVVETKARAREVTDHLDARFDGTGGRDVFISFTGCPNSCAQYQIAEIGLVGQGRKIDGKLTDHYSIHVGGGVGRTQAFGREVGLMVPADQVKFALENLLSAYERGKQSGESFRQFALRHDDAAVRTMIKTGAAIAHIHEFTPDPVDD